MSRRDAEPSLRAWAQSPYFVQLKDEEVDQLLAELVDRQYASPPKVVFEIVKRMFPHRIEEKNMSSTRVVPKLSSRAAPPTPPPQSARDIDAEFTSYAQTNHWELVASQFAKPYVLQNGRPFIGSRTNMQLLKNKLTAMGLQRIGADDIKAAVNELVRAGVFERMPVQAPPPPPPSADELAREAHNKTVRIERKLNDRDTSPIRGAKEKAQPLLKPVTNTNVAEQIASEKAAADNATVREAQRLISVFTGSSHARTFSGRAHLESVLMAALDEGVGAQEALARVQQAVDKLQDSGSIR